MCPPKGMWDPGSALTHCVGSMIVPLSLLVTGGAAVKPEQGKCDRRRTAGLMVQVHILAACLIVGLLSMGVVELCNYKVTPITL